MSTVGRAPGGAGAARLPGALHGAEHAAIGLPTLFATCDRWDAGSIHRAVCTNTGEATVVRARRLPGGAGFAVRGYSPISPWLVATAGGHQLVRMLDRVVVGLAPHSGG